MSKLSYIITENNYVWVVEIKEKGEWVRTTATALSREDARSAIQEWKETEPNTQFRAVKYWRELQK